jgi:hypothetical protein
VLQIKDKCQSVQKDKIKGPKYYKWKINDQSVKNKNKNKLPNNFGSII